MAHKQSKKSNVLKTWKFPELGKVFSPKNCLFALNRKEKHSEEQKKSWQDESFQTGSYQEESFKTEKPSERK